MKHPALHPARVYDIKAAAACSREVKSFFLFTPEKRVNFRLPLPSAPICTRQLVHAQIMPNFPLRRLI